MYLQAVGSSVGHLVGFFFFSIADLFRPFITALENNLQKASAAVAHRSGKNRVVHPGFHFIVSKKYEGGKRIDNFVNSVIRCFPHSSRFIIRFKYSDSVF